MSESTKPQPLKIPKGWRVSLNDLFYRRQPIEPDDYKEDLFQAVNKRLNLLVDAGWYGEYPDGTFRIQMLHGDFIDGKLLFDLQTPHLPEALTALQKCLTAPNQQFNRTQP